ncbi:MAG: hypothetical protein ACI8QF_003119, partial [Limisphaerales bacterium]
DPILEAGLHPDELEPFLAMLVKHPCREQWVLP